mmetsp:Transcript_38125/g.107726  ORF Transcript_38125/g.107726 Transcript_38125/m.107726 type:complete len:144 (-) Transcript_38125:2247-2678(-)
MSALRAVFSSWNLEACKEWLESPEGVGLQLGLEEETNKYFPLSNSSREVRDSLLQACEKSGVTIKYGMSMEDIRQGPGSTWECVCPQGTVACRRLIISTGDNGTECRSCLPSVFCGHSVAVSDTHAAKRPTRCVMWGTPSCLL